MKRTKGKFIKKSTLRERESKINSDRLKRLSEINAAEADEEIQNIQSISKSDPRFTSDPILPTVAAALATFAIVNTRLHD